MPFCPKCAAEYREGFSKCADCGAELAVWRQPAKPEDGKIQRTSVIEWPAVGGKPEKPAALKDLPAGIGFEFWMSLLEDCGIPAEECTAYSSGMPSAITGISGLTTELCVPESRLDEAQSIIKSTPIQQISDDELELLAMEFTESETEE